MPTAGLGAPEGQLYLIIRVCVCVCECFRSEISNGKCPSNPGCTSQTSVEVVFAE